MAVRRYFALGLLTLTWLVPRLDAYSEPAPSLQPLLTRSDCEAVPELLGNWDTDGDLSGSTWTIQELPGHNYRLLRSRNQSEDPNRAAFDICAAHLGGYLFFDAIFQIMQADGKKPLLGEDDNAFWIPLHLIGRLEVEDGAIHFRLLSDSWLQDEWESGRLQLSSSQQDDGHRLLTASSSELKEFATRFATDTLAFSYSEDFARRAD